MNEDFDELGDSRYNRLDFSISEKELMEETGVLDKLTSLTVSEDYIEWTKMD